MQFVTSDKGPSLAPTAMLEQRGTGLKSVFMAARKVYIQPVNYSFYFVHREDDSGIGMITPIWKSPRRICQDP